MDRGNTIFTVMARFRHIWANYEHIGNLPRLAQTAINFGYVADLLAKSLFQVYRMTLPMNSSGAI